MYPLHVYCLLDIVIIFASGGGALLFLIDPITRCTGMRKGISNFSSDRLRLSEEENPFVWSLECFTYRFFFSILSVHIQVSCLFVLKSEVLLFACHACANGIQRCHWDEIFCFSSWHSVIVLIFRTSNCLCCWKSTQIRRELAFMKHGCYLLFCAIRSLCCLLCVPVKIENSPTECPSYEILATGNSINMPSNGYNFKWRYISDMSFRHSSKTIYFFLSWWND